MSSVNCVVVHDRCLFIKRSLIVFFFFLRIRLLNSYILHDLFLLLGLLHYSLLLLLFLISLTEDGGGDRNSLCLGDYGIYCTKLL